MNIRDYKAAGLVMAETVRLSCIEYANALRLMDTLERLLPAIADQPEFRIRKRIMEICYRVLSFGALRDQHTLLTGPDRYVNELIAKIDRAGGFYDDKHFFVEVP